MNKISAQLLNNKIGIIPHDTVPGIVAIMNEDNAIKINKIKKRDHNKGFIILIPNLTFLNSLTQNISKETQKIIATHWPGPLTIIFKKKPSISSIITGHKTTIAIRFPQHKLLNELLNEVNAPLISTSANISGTVSMSKELNKNIDFNYENLEKSFDNKASTIIDGTLQPVKVIREGLIKIN